MKRDERGVTAVVVAIVLIALMGAAVLAIDTGQLWAVRRNAITGTDGSALAQAHYYALNHPAAGTTTCTAGIWDTVLQNNVGELINSNCVIKNVSATGGAGVVIVTATRRSDAIFSGALGIGSSAAYSMSAAMWGFSTKPLGIRPIMLCINDPQVVDALNKGGEVFPAVSPNYAAPDGSTDYAGRTAGVVHHIIYNSSSNLCGGVSGNWGWVNLSTLWNNNTNTNPGNNTNQLDQACQDPSSLSSTELNNCGLSDWLVYGWNDEVSLPQPSATPTAASDCDTSKGNSSDPCNGITGAKSDNQVTNALNYLMNPSAPVNKGDDCSSGKVSCSPATIPIILYGNPTSGSGSNGQFTLITIAMVKIWGYDMGGGNGNNPPYLDLEFMNAIVSGGCCSSSTSNNAPPSVTICDVDHDSRDPGGAAARCVFK